MSDQNKQPVSVYPNGMTRTEYELALIKSHARAVAAMLIRLFPELSQPRQQEETDKKAA